MVSLARQILKEEGFRGFYKGYVAYIFAISFWAAALPTSTDFVLGIYPFL